MDRIKIFDSIDRLCKGFSDYLVDMVGEKSFTICLSGGSTPKVIFNYWAKNYQKELPWQKMKFFWGDERCVPPEHEDSNFGMTQKYLFSKVDVSESNIFRIFGENDPDKEAQRYSLILQDEVLHDRGIPQFDLIILGLGDDGHTASIFPHEIDLWDSSENCIKATHPENGQVRISITGRIINNAKNVAFLVTGKRKAAIIKEVSLRKKIHLDQYPASRVDPLSGNLAWFVDSEAASKL